MKEKTNLKTTLYSLRDKYVALLMNHEENCNVRDVLLDIGNIIDLCSERNKF